MSIRKAIVGASLIIFLGCSRLDLAVNWADDYIIRQADNYFDLSSKQQTEYKVKVQKDIDRIKTENFPKIAKFLGKISGAVDKGAISEKYIADSFDEGTKLFREALHQFDGTAIDFLSHASDEQMKHFVEEFNDKTKGIKEETETPKERMKRQRKTYERWTKEFIGSLSSEQKDILEKQIKNNPYPYELQVKNRETFRDKLLEVHNNPASIKGFVTRIEKQRTDAYDDALDTFHEGLKSYLWDLYRSLSPDQKNSLAKKLNERASELDKIAEKAD
jgi:hypothetical protein